MDGEKGKLSNNGASAAGDSSGAIKPIQKPRQSQYFDADDDEEELATPKETDGSEDTIEVLEEIQSPRHDGSEQKRRIEEMGRSDSYKRSLAARATELEGELTRRQDDLTLALSKAEDARVEADALRLAAKGLEGDKANLEARVRDLESEKEKVVDDMLKKEVEIGLMKEDLKVEKGNAITAAKRTSEEVASLKEELKKMKMEMEKIRAIETKKEQQIASLEKELIVAIEKIKEMGIEKENAIVAASEKDVVVKSLKEELKFASEKAIVAASEKDVVVKSLKEELKFASEKAIKELADVKEKTRVAVPHQEELILSLKEELEIEKKKASAVLAEKEREVDSLKKELVLARERGMEEVKVEIRKVVADKEVEIVLVKEQLRKVMVDARTREDKLEREVKELKDWNSELEGKIRVLQFKVDGDVMVQGSRGMDLTEGEAPKISWVTAAAVAASSGTVAAAITAFCLRHNRER